MKQDLIYGDLTYLINGIVFETHNELGRYCNEKQYSDAIEQRLKARGLSCEREKILPRSFIGEAKGRNRVDFLVEDRVVLEIKAVRFVGRNDYYQARRYLDALGKKLAIIVNFRDKIIKIKRVLNPNVQE